MAMFHTTSNACEHLHKPNMHAKSYMYINSPARYMEIIYTCTFKHTSPKHTNALIHIQASTYVLHMPMNVCLPVGMHEYTSTRMNTRVQACMHTPFMCVHTLMISYHSHHTTGIIPFSLFLALQRKIKLEVCTVCCGHGGGGGWAVVEPTQVPSCLFPTSMMPKPRTSTGFPSAFRAPRQARGSDLASVVPVPGAAPEPSVFYSLVGNLGHWKEGFYFHVCR